MTKVLRDLWSGRGRMSLLIGAVAVSLFAVGTTLAAFSIMSRELPRAYGSTRPASATLETSSVDADLIARVRSLEGVLDAEARATVFGRIRVGEDWLPVVLFVVPDFDRMRVSTFEPFRGAWPPPRGTMLLQHVGLSVLDAEIGDSRVVRGPRGGTATLRISGTVYDPSLAPATMERTGYAYITPETLSLLGETTGLDEVKIVVAGDATNEANIERTAVRVAGWLGAHGRPVREIQIPPPGKHPHQGQVFAVMLLLNGFSFVALLLSGVLVASSVAAMMARQVREIGVMKAIGASSIQIARMYGVMLLILGALALVPAIPASMGAARVLSAFAARSLNVELSSVAIPVWVSLAQIAAGLLVPLLAAAVPVLRASRMSVHSALSDTSTSRSVGAAKAWNVLLGRLRVVDAQILLGARNVFRHRGRLMLTLALLAAGGAMFIAGLGTSRAWSIRVQEVNETRHYDLEVRFQEDEPLARTIDTIRSVRGVAAVEAWGHESGSWGAPAGIEIVHTYPDGGHGSFRVIGTPVQTRLVSFPLLSGRWFRAEDADADVVVLNHMATKEAIPVGDTATITIAGKARVLRVIGYVRDLGSPATAYVPAHVLDRINGANGTMRMARIVVVAPPMERARVIRDVEHALVDARIGIASSVPIAELRNAVGEHMAVLLGVILGLAALMTVVGVLGLASSMSIGVIERTREIGVMQAVGATPQMVLRVIMTEGIVVGALSGPLAIVVSLPLSALIGAVIGGLAFRAPLPLTMSHVAVLSWLGIALAASALATTLPALRASRMTAREALAHT